MEAHTCPGDGFKTVDAGRFQRNDRDPFIGQVFEGRYAIEALLGRGGFGAVYRAQQLGIGRSVAIKVLNAELGASLQEIARFQQEARALAALKHPNIVDVYDFGHTDDGHIYIVMEYVDGRSLDSLLKQGGALAVGDAIELGVRVLDALSEAHARGIVHRDLKPANILLTRGTRGRLEVKILDFGIARVSGDAAASVKLTRTGVIIGSPPYMSPEQCSGGAIDARSDLYAVGCILYECVTGRHLFQLPTPTAYLVAHISTPPDPITIGGGEPARGPLVDVIMRLLEKDADDRPADADEAQALLKDAAAAPLAGSRAGASLGPAGVSPLALFGTGPSPRLPTNTAPRRDESPPAATTIAPGQVQAVAVTIAPGSPATGLQKGTGPTARDTERRRRGLRIALLAGLAAAGAVFALLVSGGGATSRPEGERAGEGERERAGTEIPEAAKVEADEAERAEQVRAAERAAKAKQEAEAERAAKAAFQAAAEKARAARDAEADKAAEADRAAEADKAPAIAKPIVVELRSTPVATVTRNGVGIGKTPLPMSWAEGSEAPVLRLTAPGYEPLTVTLDAALDGQAQALRLKKKPATAKPNPTGATGPAW